MDCVQYFRERVPDDLQQGSEGHLYFEAVVQVAQLPEWSSSAVRAIARRLPEHMRLMFEAEARKHFSAWQVYRRNHP